MTQHTPQFTAPDNKSYLNHKSYLEENRLQDLLGDQYVYGTLPLAIATLSLSQSTAAARPKTSYSLFIVRLIHMPIIVLKDSQLAY